MAAQDPDTEMATSPTFEQPIKAFSSTAATASSPKSNDQQPHVHAATGYAWTRPEDAPGFAWQKRSAAKERAAAEECIVGWDTIIGRRYGDIGLAEAKAKGY